MFDSNTRTPGLTLKAYADAKRIPLKTLLTYGVSDVTLMGTPAVRIPYRDRDGQEPAVRLRMAMDGDNKFRWRNKPKPVLCLYGLWRLHGGPAITLVEGESDCHTLWQGDGQKGGNMTRLLASLALAAALWIGPPAWAADQALVIEGSPSATESITVSTTAIGPTAGLCATTSQGGRALVNVRTNGVFANLHSATSTPATANALDWPAGTMVIIDYPAKLRMVRSGAVDAQVIIVCLLR